MANFIETVSRIARELRRQNLTAEIRQAVLDAIDTAAEDRFFFNEVRGLTFNTVAGQQYYPDMYLVEIDTMYWFDGNAGNARRNVYEDNNIIADWRASGNVLNGQLTNYSRQGTDLRLYPIPLVSDIAIFMDGYRRGPPLVNDNDTNNWLTYGEKYIRLLAKSIIQRDVVKDYADAQVLEALAEDERVVLAGKTAQRQSTGLIMPTLF